MFEDLYQQQMAERQPQDNEEDDDEEEKLSDGEREMMLAGEEGEVQLGIMGVITRVFLS